MKITIGKFDPAAAAVPVRFSHAGVVHRRPVNACLDPSGALDKPATRERVEEVARGVAHKIELGLIS